MLIAMLGRRPLRLHSPDDGATPPAATTTDTPAGPDTANGGAAAGKSFSEDEVERIVKDRLDRAARKAAADREKAEAAAREAALKEQGEYKTLADQYQARIGELEAAGETHKATAARLEAAETALKKYATSLRDGVSEAVVKLLDKLSPAEQIDWLTDYRAEQAKQAPAATPPPARGNAPAPATVARPASPPSSGAAEPRRSTVSF